jgi:hypothetical protein
MFNRRHDFPMRGMIALEFVSDEPTRLTDLPLDETTEEAFSRTLIAAVLYQDINDIAILINSPPEILALSLNGHKHFIEVPRITQAPLSFFEFVGIIRPKLLAPLANRFVGDDDPTFGQ